MALVMILKKLNSPNCQRRRTSLSKPGISMTMIPLVGWTARECLLMNLRLKIS
jgi:hypothetical protein